jgi:sugar phosphate isomerase/epimerase
MNIESYRTFYHVPACMLMENIKRYITAGVNYEIYINAEFIKTYSNEDIDTINKCFDENNILKRIHGPFMDLSPASLDDEIRKLSLERILSGLDICRKLNCNDIVLHSHYDPVYHKRHFKQWVQRSSMVWEKIEEFARKNEITINIENSEDDSPEPILYLMKAHTSFKACFDLAHYTIFGKAPWRKILSAYPEGSINEIHLSDNDAKEDMHLVLGQGCVDIIPLFDVLRSHKHNPAITIEPHTYEDMLKDMEYIKNINKGCQDEDSKSRL